MIVRKKPSSNNSVLVIPFLLITFLLLNGCVMYAPDDVAQVTSTATQIETGIGDVKVDATVPPSPSLPAVTLVPKESTDQSAPGPESNDPPPTESNTEAEACTEEFCVYQ